MDYDHPSESHQNHQEQATVLSIWDWILTFVLVSIPVVNIIFIVMWVLDKNTNPNRRNWAIAVLLLMALGIVIWVAFMGAIVGAVSGLVDL